MWCFGLERLVLSRSPQFRNLLEKSRQSLRAGRGLTRNEFWKAARERHLGRLKQA
jgi:hypothetical protein